MKRYTDNPSDATLVAQTLAGEREAFGPLLLRYYPSVLRLCERLLGPTLEAQDVAQEAALSAFLSLDGLEEPARFGAWLHAIAANLSRMALRRRRPLSLDALGDGAAMVVLWAAGPLTPEEVQASRDVHDTIIAALNELSAVNREAVIGFYLEGYSYAELAALLGVPVSTLKGRLFFGRRQLQHSLKPLADDILKPDRRQQKELAVPTPDLVEVRLDSVRVSMLSQHRVVVLREEESNRHLPIWIGPFEADSISMALQGHQPARPLTHDLALNLVGSLGGKMQRVVINKVADNTFYAEITLGKGKQTRVVDARPSDAIALAVRNNTPIYVARAILDQAGTTLDAEQVQSSTLEPNTVVGQKIRVLIADPAPELLDQIEALLAVEPGIEVVARATNKEEVLDLATRHYPAMALIGASLPEPDGFAVTRLLRARNQIVRVIIIGDRDDRATMNQGMLAGARQMIFKPLNAAELLGAIRAVMQLGVAGPRATVAQLSAGASLLLTPEMRQQILDLMHVLLEASAGIGVIFSAPDGQEIAVGDTVKGQRIFDTISVAVQSLMAQPEARLVVQKDALEALITARLQQGGLLALLCAADVDEEQVKPLVEKTADEIEGLLSR